MSKHLFPENEFTLRLHIEKLPEGVYLATSRNLPGLVAQGGTAAEVIDIARDVARELIKSMYEHGDPMPPNLKPVRGNFEVDTAFAL